MALGDKCLQLSLGILLVDDLIADVGSIETGDEARCVAERKPLDDLPEEHLDGAGIVRDQHFDSVGQHARPI